MSVELHATSQLADLELARGEAINMFQLLDIGRLALRSLAVQARDVVADAQFDEPVQ